MAGSDAAGRIAYRRPQTSRIHFPAAVGERMTDIPPAFVAGKTGNEQQPMIRNGFQDFRLSLRREVTRILRRVKKRFSVATSCRIHRQVRTTSVWRMSHHNRTQRFIDNLNRSDVFDLRQRPQSEFPRIVKNQINQIRERCRSFSGRDRAVEKARLAGAVAVVHAVKRLRDVGVARGPADSVCMTFFNINNDEHLLHLPVRHFDKIQRDHVNTVDRVRSPPAKRRVSRAGRSVCAYFRRRRRICQYPLRHGSINRRPDNNRSRLKALHFLNRQGD